jgi:hypothetical protein
MIVNLDYLHLDTKADLKQPNFIVFNPTEKKCEFEIEFINLPMQNFKIFAGNKKLSDNKRLKLVLASQEYKYVRLKK